MGCFSILKRDGDLPGGVLEEAGGIQYERNDIDFHREPSGLRGDVIMCFLPMKRSRRFGSNSLGTRSRPFLKSIR